VTESSHGRRVFNAPFVQIAYGHIIELDSDSPVGVAHLPALAKSCLWINRYNGAADVQHWNVVKHSVVVGDMARLVAALMGGDSLMQAVSGLIADCHDLHEAITGDVTTPVKVCLGAAWRMFESRVADRVHVGIVEYLLEAAGVAPDSDVARFSRKSVVPVADFLALKWETGAGGIMTPSVDWNLRSYPPKLEEIAKEYSVAGHEGLGLSMRPDIYLCRRIARTVDEIRSLMGTSIPSRKDDCVTDYQMMRAGEYEW
jgi:hypothetical protein